MRPWIPATAAVLLSMLGIAGCQLIGTNMSTTFNEVADRLEAEEQARPAATQEETDTPAEPDGGAPDATRGAPDATSGAADATSGAPVDPSGGPTDAAPTQAAPAPTGSASDAPDTTSGDASGATRDLAAACDGLSEPACRAHRACGWSEGSCVPSPPKRR